MRRVGAAVRHRTIPRGLKARPGAPLDGRERMPKITRPLAEQALREALAEIVKLRTALGLAEGQAEP